MTEIVKQTPGISADSGRLRLLDICLLDKGLTHWGLDGGMPKVANRHSALEPMAIDTIRVIPPGLKCVSCSVVNQSHNYKSDERRYASPPVTMWVLSDDTTGASHAFGMTTKDH